MKELLSRSIDTGKAYVASGLSKVASLIVKKDHDVLTTVEVLQQEFNEIWDDNAEFAEEKDYREKVHEPQFSQAALCLSGGGVRSAAFSLGVLQVLAELGVLTKFHYLSTVSGGGYIGAWLSRWISEIEQQNETDAEKRQAATTVVNKLASSPGGSEIKQIASLRANSNYLTPKTGITSADTWTGIMLWVRNMLLNWSVFVPALFIAVLVPNLNLTLLTWATYVPAGSSLPAMLLWLGAALLTWATWQAARHLPSHSKVKPLDATEVHRYIVIPALIWAALVPYILVTGGYGDPNRAVTLLGCSQSILFWLLATSYVATIIGYLLAWFGDLRDSKLFALNVFTWIIISAIAAAALWLAIFIIGAIAHLLPTEEPASILRDLGSISVKDRDPRFVFTISILGPLGVMLAHLLLSTLYAGFRRADFQDDADREWLARLSAVCVFPTLLWAVFAGTCLFLSWLVFDAFDLKSLVAVLGSSTPKDVQHGSTLASIAKLLTAITGIISGIIAVVGGQSASTKLDLIASTPEKKKASRFELIVKVATLLFIATLYLCLARLEWHSAQALADLIKSHQDDSLFLHFGLTSLFLFLMAFPILLVGWILFSQKDRKLVTATLALAVLAMVLAAGICAPAFRLLAAFQPAAQLVTAHAFIGLALIFLITVTSQKIDVNRYSLHGIYRNRLVRGFLGAARRNREPNQFTGFDGEDNMRMCELDARVGKKRVLFPVINSTLNLVGGENLAWQERKASSFVITPLACGSATLDKIDAKDLPEDSPSAWRGAYLSSRTYGGREPDLKRVSRKRHSAEHKQAPIFETDNDATGISLGTAMTISGAAVSPSQGYNSSPATAFLLTLFNVRLGAWLANPAANLTLETKRSGPTNSLRPLLVEAFGLTNDKSANVYLSDGGHFDNLGLYEMIRRRCRFILVVDAEADKDFAFEDLGKAIRQVVIDLDADIRFKDVKMKTARVATKDSPTFAIADIIYNENRSRPGTLIYLKPTYFYETVPVDVRSYGTVNADFPHESTIDQWFSESQFESYRRLGYYLTHNLCQRHTKPFADMAEFFKVVKHRAARLKADPEPAVLKPPA